MPNVDFNFLAVSFYKIDIVPAKMFLRIILSSPLRSGWQQTKKEGHEPTMLNRRLGEMCRVTACQLASLQNAKSMKKENI